MVDFTKWPACYWDDHVKISYLQRQIIVHSLLYYEQNTNVIDDKEFDILAKQLVSLQTSVESVEAEKSTYWYLLYDFDGSTGFDIPGRLTTKDHLYLSSIAINVLASYRLSLNDKVKQNRKE